MTASSARVASWVPLSLGIVGAVFTLSLVVDLFRRKQ
jgi:hypothetical protein